jgi:hypothetical protein
MIKVLMVSYFILIAYAIGYSGQFKLPRIVRPGTTIYSILGKANLVLHGVGVVISVTLPPLTGFNGAPVLSYLSALLVTISLALYRWRPLSLRVRLFRPGGKRGKPLSEQEHTRWPYVWICGAGYCVMLVYIQTIFKIFW